MNPNRLMTTGVCVWALGLSAFLSGAAVASAADTSSLAASAAPVLAAAQAAASTGGKKPNILVIMGDDIGWYNTSLYNRGDMGYRRQTSTVSGKRAECS